MLTPKDPLEPRGVLGKKFGGSDAEDLCPRNSSRHGAPIVCSAERKIERGKMVSREADTVKGKTFHAARSVRGDAVYQWPHHRRANKRVRKRTTEPVMRGRRREGWRGTTATRSSAPPRRSPAYFSNAGNRNGKKRRLKPGVKGGGNGFVDGKEEKKSGDTTGVGARVQHSAVSDFLQLVETGNGTARVMR